MFEVVGSGFSVEPIQTGLGVLKVGATKEFTTTSIDLVSVQPLLSVMATESYFDFVDTLQREIESDTGIKFGVIEEFTFSDIVIFFR